MTPSVASAQLENPYISKGSSSDWPADLPKPRRLFPREHRLPPNEHLELVCSLERTGIVGDVIFDLRHPKLDSISWTVESLLRSREDQRRHPNRPYLWFPWYGAYTQDSSHNSAQLAAKGQKLSRSKLDRLEMEYTPEQIVYPGDKIYIAQEKSIYPADRKMRDVVQEDSVALVFLEISRADGTVVRVETPLRLFSREISSYYNNVNIITSKIRLIVERANNKRDVERIATEADGVASTINQLIHALKYDNKTSEVENIVSMSILLGQLLAKAEAATTLEPLAEAQQEFREKSRAAGIKSGKTRRQAPWRQIAQDLAIQTREKHPDLSQDKVAGEIFALWKDDQPPTHKTLKEFVSELERDGVILRRATQRKL
jgi:hypothetical protein